MLKRTVSYLALFFLCFNFFVVLFFSQPTSVNADFGGMLGLINNYRVANGLTTLSEDKNLTNAACWLAGDMAAKDSLNLSHTDSLGRDMPSRLSAFGVGGGTRGENIASLTNQANSAQKVFEGWKASPGHNANMLNPAFSRIGIGNAYRGANVTYYWATDFASGTAGGSVNGCSTNNNPPLTPPATKPPAKNPPISPATTPVANPPSSPEPIAPAPPTTNVATINPQTALSKQSTQATKVAGGVKKDGKQEGLVLGVLLVISFFVVVPILALALI